MTARILIPLLTVSTAYVLSFQALQFLPNWLTWGGPSSSVASASLCFLPHGVRVLTAWFYGYWSILLLAPASYATLALRLGWEGMTPAYLAGSLFGVICAAVAFDWAARSGFDARMREGHIPDWKKVMIVGVAASLINSIGTNIAFGNSTQTALAFWFGDVIGLFAALVILMSLFKLMRRIT